MKKGAYDASLGPLFKPKMTRQGVRDLNGIKPKAPKPHLAPTANGRLDESNFREWAQRAIAKYGDQNKLVDAIVWAQIIGYYNIEIDRLTAELASAKKGDRT